MLLYTFISHSAKILEKSDSIQADMKKIDYDHYKIFYCGENKNIDDIVIFNSLNRSDIHKIIDIELKGLYERVYSLGYSIRISPAAKDFITEKGYDVQYGARPLKRAIQKYIEDAMAEYILRSELSLGDTIYVGFNQKSGIKLRVLKKDEFIG